MIARLSRLAWWQWLGLSLLGLVGVLGLAGLLANHWPGGVDYYYTFYPAARLWMAGETRLYDDHLSGYFHPPWTLWVYALFALFPYDIGRALLSVVSTAILAIGAFTFAAPGRSRPWVLAFALFNLHTFDLLYRGQCEAFTVGGVVLAWAAIRQHRPFLLGTSYIALMISPPNAIPLILFLLWYVWKQWGRRNLVISMIPCIAVGGISLLLHGDWPIRWFAMLTASPQAAMSGPGWWMVTIWRASKALGFSPLVPWLVVVIVLFITGWAWIRVSYHSDHAAMLDRVMLIISATFLLTPYSLSYRLMLLVAVVMPYLARQCLGVVVGLYFLTFLPILRLIIGPQNSWIDIFFVAAVFAATFVLVTRKRSAREMSTDSLGEAPPDSFQYPASNNKPV